MNNLLQYLAKEMQTKLGVFRSLFSRKFDEISSKRSRIFFESNEISLLSWRKFAMAIFPQCEILLEMEAGCNETLVRIVAFAVLVPVIA